MRSLALSLFLSLSIATPAAIDVSIHRLPEPKGLCHVGALSTGDLFVTDSEVWVIAMPPDNWKADPSHTLYGANQIPRPEWERERIQLSDSGLNRFAIGLLSSAAPVLTLDRPETVYAVALRRRPGLLVRMDRETWVLPASRSLLRVYIYPGIE